MNIRDRQYIIELVKRENVTLGRAIYPYELEGKTHFRDIGRELRRLFEAGKLRRDQHGRYYAFARPASLGRFI